jgi:hypothetical protein
MGLLRVILRVCFYGKWRRAWLYTSVFAATQQQGLCGMQNYHTGNSVEHNLDDVIRVVVCVVGCFNFAGWGICDISCVNQF